MCVTWLWSSEAGIPTIESYSYFSCGPTTIPGFQRLLPESPATSASPTSSNESTQAVDKTPRIIGGTIGGVIALILVAIGLFCLERKRRQEAYLDGNLPKYQRERPAGHRVDSVSRPLETTTRSELESHRPRPDAEAIRESSVDPVADEVSLTELGRGSANKGGDLVSPISELEGRQ